VIIRLDVVREGDLLHYGVKGMQWGVRKRYRAYQNKVHTSSPGPITTTVRTKTGEKVTIRKEKPGPLALAAAKLTGRDPKNNVSTVSIHNNKGTKVGSFQMWREGPSVIRGEWLEIGKSHQGKGYSKAAIQGLLAGAKKDKALKEVRLQVPSNAEAAKHIYSSLGFKKDVDLGVAPGYGNLEDWVYNVE
jgi:hypothetical protein